MRGWLMIAALTLLAGCDPQAADPAPAAEEATVTAPEVPPLELKPTPQKAVDDKAATDPEMQEALMTPPENLVLCPEVRPELCTMEYMPVMGWLEDGSTQEYANKCGACADGAVVGYLPAESKQPAQ